MKTLTDPAVDEDRIRYEDELEVRKKFLWIGQIFVVHSLRSKQGRTLARENCFESEQKSQNNCGFSGIYIHKILILGITQSMEGKLLQGRGGWEMANCFRGGHLWTICTMPVLIIYYNKLFSFFRRMKMKEEYKLLRW